MRGLGRFLGVVAIALALLAAPQRVAAQDAGLVAFKSDADLKSFLAKRRAAQKRRDKAMNDIAPPPVPVEFPTPPPMPAPPPPPMAAPPSPMAEASAPVPVAKVAAPGNQPNITNRQEADVDEGGIVKVHGQHLVILRRGRLFTVAVNDKSMTAIDRTNAFPPGTSGQGAWYDEMLIAGNHVVVIGYSYARGGTEINRFKIDEDGKLAYEDTHHLRSNDYYSSENYASRLIGTKLIFYTPLNIYDETRFLSGLPAVRRWEGDNARPFKRVVSATHIYVPAPLRRDNNADISTLHSVTSCDLAAVNFSCDATAVLGSWSRNFYVSGSAVYIWIAGAIEGGNRYHRASRSIVYRMPLNGSRPGAAQAWGSPVNQFSFREDKADGVLNVVVRAGGRGEAMWRAVVSDGDAALLRLPLSLFGNGDAMAPLKTYRNLPLNRSPNWSFHNRFVGRHLIYSAGEFAADAGEKTVFVAPLDGGEIAQIRVPHAADRIEVMGSDTIIIGNDAKARLGFSAIELRKDGPVRGDTYFLAAAREGEQRSHAFFYRPDANSPDGASGILGLPVTRALNDNRLARFLGSGSAITFLRRNNRLFDPAGELEAQSANARDDGCQASCVDWYGNARPIFLGDRIFALMGYELVEGRVKDSRISEIGRLDFAPPPVKRPVE